MDRPTEVRFPAIDAHTVYTGAELAKILKINERTLGSMRRRGLKALALDPRGRCYRYLGRDVLAFLEPSNGAA